MRMTKTSPQRRRHPIASRGMSGRKGDPGGDEDLYEALEEPIAEDFAEPIEDPDEEGFGAPIEEPSTRTRNL